MADTERPDLRALDSTVAEGDDALTATAAATAALVDGGSAENNQEVEEFLKKNPAPSQALFEKHHRILAPIFARRFDVRGVHVENLPAGGALLLANHVTFFDHFLIMMALKRPVRFVMNKRIFRNISTLWMDPLYELKWIGPVLCFVLSPLMLPIDLPVRRFLRSYAIPVLPRKEGGIKEENELSLRIARALARRGELVLIYPEGRRTTNGELMKFGNGFMDIAKNIPEPTFVIYLRGLWGTKYSRMSKRLVRALKKGEKILVDVIVGDPLDLVNVPIVREAMRALQTAQPGR